MRAAVALRVDEANPLEALELKDGWPTPEPGPGQLRIRLAATTVNMHDLWALRGVGVRRDSFPRVLGCDIAGWDDKGNEVMVTGSFADPDAGGGDETFDRTAPSSRRTCPDPSASTPSPPRATSSRSRSGSASTRPPAST